MTDPSPIETTPDVTPLRPGGWIVATLFLASGTIHLVRPDVFEPMVPDVLPAHRAIVLVSGVAELGCGAGLVARRTRRHAGLASAALLVAIFPANLQMAWDAWRDWRAGEAGAGYLAATLGRLPLQLPLIWWAWRQWRPGRRGPSET